MRLQYPLELGWEDKKKVLCRLTELPVKQPRPTSPARSFKASGLEEKTTQDEPAESLLWDAGLAGEMTIGNTYPSRLHDIQVHPTVLDQSLNPPSRTTDRAPVEMDLSLSTWPSFPAGADMPHNRLSNPFARPHYHPSLETSGSISTILNFDSPSGPAFQPLPVTQPEVDVSGNVPTDPSSEQSGLPVYKDFPGSPPGEIGATDASDCNTYSPFNSYGTLSPRSLDTSLITTETPKDQEFPDKLTGIPDGTSEAGFDGTKHTRSNSLFTRRHIGHHPFEEHRGLTNSEKWLAYLTTVTDHYGIDYGRPDMDLGNNDDDSAIDITDALDAVQSQIASSVSSPRTPAEKERGMSNGDKYDYYAFPVPIDIPRYISPLPASLFSVPINLMYFHHFLNHTARILVPHDCGDNPFRSVLPSMAIGDPNLLNLMLAYSASHRARFLGHPEPANRIAYWVSNVFPSLRMALEDTQEKITDSHLATAIMLLSLKIVSPGTFEVPIPWQSHLKLARDLFLARQSQIAYPGNRIGAFLTRWLGYLDILGSLSCRRHQPPLLAYYTVLSTCSSVEDWDEFAVDCFTGFTPRTGLFLMQLGGLVNQCDNERFDEMGTFLPEWRPSIDVIHETEALITDWETLETQAHALEQHYQELESSDMLAVDRAFRYAGLLHLRRRVLGDAPDSDAVSKALDGLMQSVTAIKCGSTVEAGVLFPIFTAGCETQNLEQRNEIKERLEALEATGMKQIQSARTLMQRCWDAGLPWIAFAQGEFIGLRFLPASSRGFTTSTLLLLSVSFDTPVYMILCFFLFVINTRLLHLTRVSLPGPKTCDWRRRAEKQTESDEMAYVPFTYSTDLLDGRNEDIQISPLRPLYLKDLQDENAPPLVPGQKDLLGNLVDDLKMSVLDPKWDGKMSWALKGSSVFDGAEEELDAFHTRSNMLVARQPYFELWVFQYGLRYIPSISDRDVYRTIRIDELPPDRSLSQILPLVVGEIYSARLADTSAITGYNTAMIIFVTQEEALKFVVGVKTKVYPLPFGKLVPVHTPTYPIPADTERLIKRDGYTRTIGIFHTKPTLKMELTRVLTNPYLKYAMQLEGIEDGPAHGEVDVKMISVKGAAMVFEWLRKHPTLGQCQFRFLKQNGTPSEARGVLEEIDAMGTA
ncbi:fungal specific transcription factor domain-containing protein [Aspergillus undulatus]|uniref:fungal specific transcription factor domain-containing protein n=1 Tax=Aspergillus undulatus TaxID=1810928 RepID=UPI003CCD5C9B